MPKITTTATRTLALALALTVCAGCSSSPTPSTQTEAPHALSVLHYEDVDWTPLNPARGDNSPRAGTLWGDRSADVATGFLVQFRDGFSSPPHIHNVSYRGIVISGLIHNDDPDAAKMWMPAGSYWTQPKGEAHITAAKGSMNMAYIEIDEGPYRVHATDAAFESAERPVNIDASNIVWLDSGGGAQIAYLWGKQGPGHTSGVLLKLPKHFNGTFNNDASHTRGVVIRGQLKLQTTRQPGSHSLNAGSAFDLPEAFTLPVSNSSDHECIIYIRSDGALTVSGS